MVLTVYILARRICLPLTLPPYATLACALVWSAHDKIEIVCTLVWQPTYIAIGHIFPTNTKLMTSDYQGLEQLQQLVTELLPIPTDVRGGKCSSGKCYYQRTKLAPGNTIYHSAAAWERDHWQLMHRLATNY